MPTLAHLPEMLAVMADGDVLYFCDWRCQKYFITREVPELK